MKVVFQAEFGGMFTYVLKMNLKISEFLLLIIVKQNLLGAAIMFFMLQYYSDKKFAIRINVQVALNNGIYTVSVAKYACTLKICLPPRFRGTHQLTPQHVSQSASTSKV